MADDKKMYGIGKTKLSNLPKQERIMAVVERIIRSIQEK